MAIAGLISNRNFGSFIGSGNVCQSKNGIRQPRRQRSDIVVSRYGQGKLQIQNASGLTSGVSYSSFIQVTSRSDERAIRSFAVYPQQRRGRCECYLSPDCSIGGWLRPNSVPCQHSQYVKVNRTRTYYKSEDSELPEAAADSLKSVDGAGEAVLQQASPWWKEFPKRWVIVLLCFSAFLLCNMDRVNMSIAILPMSKEFNWNSATVGLIQSSFFWGYLTTQIVGGILADKIGGKLVLGFGVVVNSNDFDSCCCKAWPPILTPDACFYGNWRGRCYACHE